MYRDEKNKLYNIISKLELLNPLNVLSRGYSITYYNNNTLKSIKDVKKSDLISVKVLDGVIDAEVVSMKEEKHG